MALPILFFARQSSNVWPHQLRASQVTAIVEQHAGHNLNKTGVPVDNRVMGSAKTHQGRCSHP